MVLDLSRFSVAEIRERFLSQEDPVPAHLLAKMQRDPRGGVRKICQYLKKRREGEKREQRRIESMLNFERLLWNSGVRYVAGVDEVGVGPLAGPLVAAAVVFSPQTFIPGINDSKRLAPKIREQLAQIIRTKALGVGIGLAKVTEIDQRNVYHAGILAMRRAVQGLPVSPTYLLLDAKQIPEFSIPQTAFIKGDSLSFSIAAASIIAKTYRDQLMRELDLRYPQYGFAQHKGYSTPEHQKAIQKHGPSAVHRRSFAFIDELCGGYSILFYALRDKLMRLSSVQATKEFEKEFNAVRSKLSQPEQRKIKLMLARRWANL
ncbi:ribonuclease HII [Acidobacteria bacterium AH-259-L09]|nr:ribonuclease HII [Acidobacteria bacterium AH-259-L09]